MKITRVEATSHRVPAKVPLLHEPIIREIVFVRVETDGGVTGYGLTGPIQRFAARELINREIAPLLVGKDPLATERHWYDLFLPAQSTCANRCLVLRCQRGGHRPVGHQGQAPLASRYGGCWADTAPLFPHTSPSGCWSILASSSSKRQSTLSAQGHDKLKMVVAINGAQDPADAARVRAVREAVGDQVELMVDANYLFSFPVALDLAKRIEPYAIKWFEEPVYGNDARLLANLRRQAEFPSRRVRTRDTSGGTGNCWSTRLWTFFSPTSSMWERTLKA